MANRGGSLPLKRTRQLPRECFGDTMICNEAVVGRGHVGTSFYFLSVVKVLPVKDPALLPLGMDIG